MSNYMSSKTSKEYLCQPPMDVDLQAMEQEEQAQARLNGCLAEARTEIELMNSIENPGAFVRNANRVRHKLQKLEELHQRLLASF